MGQAQGRRSQMGAGLRRYLSAHLGFGTADLRRCSLSFVGRSFHWVAENSSLGPLERELDQFHTPCLTSGGVRFFFWSLNVTQTWHLGPASKLDHERPLPQI